MSSSRDVLRLVDCVGDGYAVSTTAELEFIQRVAEQTGVVLDPVYSGKVRGGGSVKTQHRACTPT